MSKHKQNKCRVVREYVEVINGQEVIVRRYETQLDTKQVAVRAVSQLLGTDIEQMRIEDYRYEYN